MDFDLSAEQAVVKGGSDGIFNDVQTLPTGSSGFFVPGTDVERLLAGNGFYDLAITEGFGPLDAALLVFEAARLPVLVEAGASALVAPMLGLSGLERPIALTDNRRGAIRNLPTARTLILLEEGEALVAPIRESQVEACTSVIAYPFGRVAAPEVLKARSLGPGSGSQLERWWRVALAAEAAGLMRAALDTTVEYVKQREQFGRPIGAFQAVKHRLAVCAQIANGARWLALRAAESGDPTDAAIAAIYVQDQMRHLVNDCHQFHGAIGLTLEYPLHLWTYRLKALQGELGGLVNQAEAAVIFFEEKASRVQ